MPDSLLVSLLLHEDETPGTWSLSLVLAGVRYPIIEGVPALEAAEAMHAIAHQLALRVNP